MITIYSDAHYHHNAQVELIDGLLRPPVENPKRVEQILHQVHVAQLGDVVAPQSFELEAILQVHDASFVSFLQTAWQEWTATQRHYDALPLNWATRTMRHDRPPESIDGRLSYYSFDAGTPITAGTWQAAKASADVALTGQACLTGRCRAAFALCRPPGHHAARDVYGGYCFLNNAAIAAQALRDRGASRVAVLDVDYHHGNGTQAIFYDRADVLFVSLHADPSQDFPFFLGYSDETGAGAGDGFNQNYPLRWGTDWAVYQEALKQAIARLQQYSPDAVVVSLGVDTFEHDPIANFRLQSEDFLKIGRAIATLNVPTLFVMEGGYALDEIGLNAVNVLIGFEDH